jgi:predicted nucleic acid-binding Zn finger protein
MPRGESLSGERRHSGEEAFSQDSREQDEDSEEYLVRHHGERGTKAIQACRDGKVEKYLDFYVVHGMTGTYVVEDDFCTCSNFLFRGNECWHILAVRYARFSGLCVTRDEWYQEKMEKPPETNTI